MAGRVLILALLLLANQASGQGPVIRHSDYQLDTTDPHNSPYVTPLPFCFRGVVLNNTEDWLSPWEQFDNQGSFPPFLGGEAEIMVQAVDLDATPFDPYPACSSQGPRTRWQGTLVAPSCGWDRTMAICRLCPIRIWRTSTRTWRVPPGKRDRSGMRNLTGWVTGGPGSSRMIPTVVRAGDLVEVRVPVNGLVFNGKHNVNERHTIDPLNDFEVVILAKGFGLPAPDRLTLDLLKDARDQAIYDPTRQMGGEHYQGARVQLQGVTFETLTAGAALQSNTTLSVVDATGRSLDVYLGLNPGFDSAFVPAGWLNLTGVLDQESASGTDGYRLLVLTPDDIQPALWGDFNGDQVLEIADIDLLLAEAAGQTHSPAFDLNADSRVDQGDVRVWVRDLKQTWIGDADLNGLFDSADMVAAFQAGRYELDRDATWQQGDWTGDLRFTSTDLVSAFQDGGYERGIRLAVAIPEPHGLLLFAAGFVGFVQTCRLRGRRRFQGSKKPRIGTDSYRSGSHEGATERG